MARQLYVDGVDRVARIFAAAPRENVERIADALNRGAQEIAAQAQRAAPVQAAADGGALRADIAARTTDIRVAGSKRAAVVYVVAGTEPQTMVEARMQEFGRAPGGDGDQAEHPGHAAQPFFFPAYFSIRRRVLSRVRREVRRAARAAAAIR